MEIVRKETTTGACNILAAWMLGDRYAEVGVPLNQQGKRSQSIPRRYLRNHHPELWHPHAEPKGKENEIEPDTAGQHLTWRHPVSRCLLMVLVVYVRLQTGQVTTDSITMGRHLRPLYIEPKHKFSSGCPRKLDCEFSIIVPSIT